MRASPENINENEKDLHSRHRQKEEDFMEILLSYDIKTLVDVRSFPKSKMPVFTRENLENLLKKEGINYVFLGKELGGFRKGAMRHTQLPKSSVRELMCLKILPQKAQA